MNLIKAAFPRGGEGNLRFGVLGIKREFIQDTRKEDEYAFDSLKQDPTKMTDQEQRKKIKTLAEKYDPPKRVEIKELELQLR